MATERFGIPASATTCMLAVIFAMHFFVRTAYGISSESFSTTSSLLILGVLQGSGAAPCIWMCVSNVLLQALDTLTAGFQAHCSRHRRSSCRPGEAFVDDADLWLTSETQTGPELTASMQKVAQHWERLLFASGGGALPSKTAFIIYWIGHGTNMAVPPFFPTPLPQPSQSP